MRVQVPGVGSGLSGIVDQIIAAEKIPIKNMEIKKSNQEAKLSLVNDLEGRVNSVKRALKDIIGTRKFKDYTLTSSNESIISGQITSENIAPGQWNIEVLKLANNSGALTNPVEDRNKTTFGVGYIKFDTPEGEKKVYINNKNNTLDGIASAINSAQVGVSATIIEDGADENFPFRMIVSSETYGKSNSLDFPTIYLLDGEDDLWIDIERNSTNGLIKVNGFEVETVGNSIDGLVPGTRLDMKNAVPGETVSVQTSEDMVKIEGKLKGFVDSINSVLSFIQQQNSMNENSDTSRTLGGQAILRTLEMRIRGVIQSPASGVEGSIKRLNQLGVEFTRSGMLQFNQQKFNNVMKTSSQDVLGFFKGKRGADGSVGGFISKVNDLIKNSLNTRSGIIANKKKGLRSKIDRISRSVVQKEDRIARKEEQLRRRFARMEEQLSKIKAQGSQVGGIASA